MQSSPAPPPATPLPVGRATILVVEDELLVRMVTSDLLRAEGYSVIEAFNADEAVAILKSEVPIDLILSDVRMPGEMDGLGLLAFVKEAYPTIPVIITSGHLQANWATADGVEHFLAKPYRIARAIELIECALEKSR